METLFVVALALLLAALWLFRARGPESLEALVKQTMQASLPSMEEVLRRFAEKYPEDFRKGCEITFEVRARDASRLPPEYLKAFEKQEVGNGQPSVMP